MFNKKFRFLALSLTALSVGAGLLAPAFATDEVIDATIEARAAIAITPVTDMDFGIVDFAAVHSGTITLGTNGTAALAGATGLALSGATTAGVVTVTGDGASTVDISCETGGTLTDGVANNTLTLGATEIVIGAGAAFGGGTACAGLGTPSLTNDFGTTANPTIRMGASIDTTADDIDGTAVYATDGGGAADNPVTLRITYQ